MRLTTHHRVMAERLSHRAVTVCVVCLPFALLYARALAEILIGVTDALFLIHFWLTRQWRRPFPGRAFAGAALTWWLWQIICSAFGTGGLLLSLVLIRLPLFAVALCTWVLTGARARAGLWVTIGLAVAWIVIECWQQYLTGHNIFGAGRWGDGALTGPFTRPRAGPELILTLFAVLLPAASHLIGGAGRMRRVSGVLLAVLGAATVLLIGQRMPSVLLLLGLLLSGLLLPRLRIAFAAALGAGIVLLAAMPVVAPSTYDKLVVHTHEQLDHFAASAYGQIWLRAAGMVRANPWMGQGFDAFRRACAGHADDACNIHPHNYYLEQAVNGGLPLLVLFTIMIAMAFAALARGRLTPARAGLLVGFVLALWPVASTSAFTSMPNSGWIFLLLGAGLAASET